MAELELRPATIVVDTRAVDSYVRDAKLAVIDATAYVVVIGVFAAVRILGEVPFQRASVGIYLAVALASISLKRWLLGRGAMLLASSAVVGLAVGLPVLLFLVERNRGTLFAEAVALLVTLAVVHLVDRVAVDHG
jgi:hypothetical protein